MRSARADVGSGDPQQVLLLLTMVGVGIAWASTLSMPYAVLAASLPPARTGVYMGIFNFFIVTPEILASLFFGWIMIHLAEQQSYLRDHCRRRFHADCRAADAARERSADAERPGRHSRMRIAKRISDLLRRAISTGVPCATCERIACNRPTPSVSAAGPGCRISDEGIS